MLSKRGEFKITRCDPAKRNDCKSDEEINEYIKDLQVEIWSTFLKFDTTIYDRYPAN